MHLFNSHSFTFISFSVFITSFISIPSQLWGWVGGGGFACYNTHMMSRQTLRANQGKKKQKTFSFAFIHCTIQKDTKRQRLQRLSIALASHLLFSHDSDPPTPGIAPVPTGDSASLGDIIKPCARHKKPVRQRKH